MRVRRSLHFVPGANEKMLHKALVLPADSLILDLEDAVTPDNKDAARDVICDWLREVEFGRQERIVRINPLDTPWGRDDLEAVIGASLPDALLVPKVRTPDDLLEIDAIVARQERAQGHTEGSVELIALATETPEGVFHARQMASAPRVTGLTWGAEDLSAVIGAHRTRDAEGRWLPVFAHCQVVTLLAAHAGQIAPLDTVYVDIRDTDGLREDSRRAAEMGFLGKITIHPAQIEIVNEAFTPSGETVADARELLAAFEENEAAGRMAFAFRGEMVDVPHLNRARRILATAEAIADAQ